MKLTTFTLLAALTVGRCASSGTKVDPGALAGFQAGVTTYAAAAG